MTPTPEQEAIRAFARESSENLLVTALAGAAKTSTLVLIGRALAQQRILSLAFNKKIAMEMKERLSSNCESKTLNGLGHFTWMQTIGKRVNISSDKCYLILSQLVEDLPTAQKEEAFALFSETLKAFKQGKSTGFVPSEFANANRLLDEEEFFSNLEEEPTPLQEDLLIRASSISVKQGFDGLIDFDDQILLPTVFPASFAVPSVIMVDEAQDLSSLNHAMLAKMMRGNKRLIAVGDRNQAIYGFRGAHENSMDLLRERFAMSELNLTISFRCPQAVVREARWRAPMMQWPEWAVEGEVSSMSVKKPGGWTIEDIPDHAAVLCRNNSPLFSLALRFIQAGRFPTLASGDIGKGLLKIMQKLGDKDMPQEAVIKAINEWEASKTAKSREPAKIADQAQCLRIFAEMGPNLRAAIAYAEKLFASSGPVQFMTIHRSKGLEFNDVFILDKDLIRVGRGQEDNLLYVAQTRAKRSLTYITTETFLDAQ